MKKKLLMLFFASGLLLSACGDDSESVENESPDEDVEDVREIEETEEENKEEGATTFDGTTLVTDDYTIEITDYKVIETGEEGNEYGDKPVIAYWFNTNVHEDITDREIDPNIAWISVFEAVQDNDPDAVNTLNVGFLPDEAHLDSQMQTIKPGGTVESSVSYELDDLETPVTLTAGDMLGDDYGSHEYPLD